jgi:hypothetical protein
MRAAGSSNSRFQTSLKLQVSSFWFAQLLVLALALVLVPSCTRPQQIGPSYTLVKSDSTFANQPLSSLHFQGSNVWPAVLLGSEQSFHDGSFVFLSPVPGRAGDFDARVSPQLFAIREAGPAVLISERIYGQPMRSELTWSVENFLPSGGGLSVNFVIAQAGGSKIRLNRLVTWAEIDRWLLEADGASAQQTTPLAPYRLLLFTATNHAASPGNSLPFKTLDQLDR